MSKEIKKELKTTTKKAAASLAPWAVVGLLFCCGGPIVLLALLSGGLAGLLGFLSSNVFLISAGIFTSLLATVWFITRVKTKN